MSNRSTLEGVTAKKYLQVAQISEIWYASNVPNKWRYVINYFVTMR